MVKTELDFVVISCEAAVNTCTPQQREAGQSKGNQLLLPLFSALEMEKSSAKQLKLNIVFKSPSVIECPRLLLPKTAFCSSFTKCLLCMYSSLCWWWLFKVNFLGTCWHQSTILKCRVALSAVHHLELLLFSRGHVKSLVSV